MRDLRPGVVQRLDQPAAHLRPSLAAGQETGMNHLHYGDNLDVLRESIATDESRCNSALQLPLCWISKSPYWYTREYLDRTELDGQEAVTTWKVPR